MLAADRMRSLDSPVLKPALIRFSAARTIGPAAPDDAVEQAEVMPWPASVWPDTEVSAVEPVDDPATTPQPLPVRAVDGPSQRRIEDADARLRAIEAEIADAEARLAETQALLETFEREANLACTVADDARQQAAAIREQARQEGYAAGTEQAERDMAERVAAIAALAEAAVRARAELLQRVEPEVIDLAFEIARKVIGEHLALDREAIAEVARRAISVAGQSDTYYVHLHPDDAQRVEQFLHRDTQGTPLQVIPDDRLCPGDCLVRTQHGQVDASIEAQLREIRAHMVGDA